MSECARRPRLGLAGGSQWCIGIAAPSGGIKVVWVVGVSRMSPTCGGCKAGSACVPCMACTRAVSWESAMGEVRSIGLVGTALDMVGTACGGFLAGVVFLDGWGTQFTS